MNYMEISNEDLKKIIQDVQRKIVEKQLELEEKNKYLQELIAESNNV